MKGPLLKTLLAGLLLIALGTFLAHHVRRERQLAECHQNLHAIANAVWAMRLNSGRTPGSIEEMVPKHLSALPVCPAGESLSGAYRLRVVSKTRPCFIIYCVGNKHDRRTENRPLLMHDNGEGLHNLVEIVCDE